MIRAFLAVELPEDLLRELAQLQRDLKQRLTRELSRNVRLSWVQPTSIHLTMKFLGDMDEQFVSPMQEAIGLVVKDHRMVSIPLEQLGAFPRPQQPRVLWVGPSAQWEQSEDAKRLVALHQAIEGCCRSLDFAPESRPLNPHLTLARIREGERQIGQVLATTGVMDSAIPLGSLVVQSIVLIKSELNPTGSIYTRLWEVRLSGS
jgi:RNA 2',3'-cyclic 3'-phosphodiesterase